MYLVVFNYLYNAINLSQMKHKYLILGLLTFIVKVQLYAQSCPEISFIVPLPTEEVVFIYDNPGPACMDRPAAIVIDGSAYSLGNCDTYSSRYVLSSGTGVIDPDNYTVTYGGLTCEYSDGTLLGLEDYERIFEKAILLYPNPIVNTNELHLNLKIPIAGKISIYDLTGKKLLNVSVINDRDEAIDISPLSNGLYLMQLQAGRFRVTKKFIIAK